MKNKLDIKSIFKKRARKPGSLRDQQLMHPEREWVVGLIISFLLFLLAAFVSTYVYFKNQSVNVQTADDDSKEVIYRESLVKDALTIIRSREEKLRSLNKEIVPVEIEEVETSTTTPEIPPDLGTTTDQ